jgi:hypothetical protein
MHPGGTGILFRRERPLECIFPGAP